LLRDQWMMHEPSIQFYAKLASDILAGKEIATGFFSSLKLPDVPDNVAMITMAGVLTKSDVCGSVGSRSLALQVAAAARSHSIESILLFSESCPGGQVNGTQELADAVIAARKVKPVTGVISGMACSAGYWPLAVCDETYALSETDIIGCIGVVAKMRNPKTVNAEEEDIIEVYSDLSPDKNIEGRDMNAYKQQTLNPLAEVFHENVKAGRGKRLKLNKENVLSGKTYIARDAEKYGMIDGIMPMHKIIARSLFLARTQKNRK